MAVMAKEFYRFLQTAVSQQSAGSNFYPSTLDIQQSLRSGWLRKQGGVVKSWQRRWFTMKGDHVYYYASQDETKSPLGVIFLPGSHVVEHLFSAADPDKFLFEIVPDGGDRQRMAPTHETYLLAAESDEERKEWIKAIKHVLYACVGGAIFGRSLEETLHFEMVRDPRRKVPEIVQVCTDYILKKGLTEEGIFRLPGRTTVLKKICDDFDRGERPEIDVPEMDVHTVASLLKCYLRDLPGPLIPSEFYESVMRIVMREMPVAEEPALDRLSELIRSIPVANYNVLQYICQFLRKIASQSDKNKMTPVNLATIFVQSFIRPEDDDPSLLMATASCRTISTLCLIERADRVFNVEYTSEGGAVVVEDMLGLESTKQNSVDEFETAQSVSINPDLLGLEINGSGVPAPAMRRHNVGRVSQRTASIEVVMGQGLLMVTENNKRGAVIMPQLRSSNESSGSGSESQSTNDEPGSSELQKPVPMRQRDTVERQKQPIAPPRPSQQKPKPGPPTPTTTTSPPMIPTAKTLTATTTTTQKTTPTTASKTTTPATSTKSKSSVGTDSAAVETLINLDTQNFTELDLRAHIERLSRELIVRQKIIEELSEHAQLNEQKHEKQVDALLQTMAKERSRADKCSKKLQMYMEKYGTAE